MRVKRRRNSALVVIIFLAVVVGAVFGLKFLLDQKDVSRDSGVIYSDTLTASERTRLEGLINSEKKYALPIKISAKTVPARDDYVISELIPTTDWYSLETSISTEQALSLANTLKCSETYCSENDTLMALVEPENLSDTQKLLAIDGHYYLDDPTTGAVYRTLEFELDESGEEKMSDRRRVAAEADLAELKSTLKDKLVGTIARTKDQILTLAQTGVTALSRAMVSKLNQVGDGAFFAANLKDFLSAKDLTHISNEVSFADNCPGGTNTVTLCSDWRMLDTITAIGTDIIELTGNHNDDYSTQANLNTIAKYEELGLKTFGGGKNEEEARKPLELSQKNAKITLLGYNNSTTTTASGGATGNTPGANLYSEAVAKQQIEEAKARGDFVIVDVQYFECYSYPDGYVEMPACDAPISGQQTFFRHLIDLGADMVVGTQAHQPQTYELYQGKPIYYGLGNLFFDQTYWPGTTRGYILTHYFLDGKYVQTKMSATVYDDTYQTRLMSAEAERSFFARLLNSSPHGE